MDGLSIATAKKGNGLIPPSALAAMSADSRSRAVRLRAMGWKPVVGKEDFEAEVKKDIELLREQGEGTNSRALESDGKL